MESSESSRQREIVRRLNRGSSSVFADLDQVYRQRLIDLIEREMNRRLRRREDPEDIVQLALASFFRRAKEGEFHFDHPGALWSLLRQIAHRKLLKRAEYHGAAVRDIDKDVFPGAQQAFGREPSASELDLLGDALGRVLGEIRSPDPKIVLLQLCGYTLDEIRTRALHGLQSPDPEIFDLWLQGFRATEIAHRVQTTRARVRYTLQRILERLRKWLGEGEGEATVSVS